MEKTGDIDFNEMAGKFGIQPRALKERIKVALDNKVDLVDVIPLPKPRSKNQAWKWDREVSNEWFKNR